jgi:uncharacterized membrane protein
MFLLVVAVLAFVSIYLLPSLPQYGHRLTQRFGARWSLFHGSASLLSVVLMIAAWRASPAIPLYDPPLWSRIAGFLLVLLAFLCLGIFLFRGRLRQLVRWPWPLAIMLLALGHLLTLGDLAGLVLFGGLFVCGAASVGASLAEGVRPSPECRAGHDLLSVLAGVALYGVTTQLHGIVAGVPVMALSG